MSLRVLPDKENIEHTHYDDQIKDRIIHQGINAVYSSSCEVTVEMLETWHSDYHDYLDYGKYAISMSFGEYIIKKLEEMSVYANCSDCLMRPACRAVIENTVPDEDDNEVVLNEDCPKFKYKPSPNLTLNDKPISEAEFNRVMSDWSKDSVQQCVNGLHGDTIALKLPWEYLLENIGKEG